MNEKPKLLHELDWYPAPVSGRVAGVCGHEIFECDGLYSILTPEETITGEASWTDLDPLTAQAVLFHIQQTLSLREVFEPLLISPNGLHESAAECREYWDKAPGDPDQFARAIEWLQQAPRTKHVNKRAGSSYSLKHVAEQWHKERGAPDGGYISNGHLIMAAHRLGFEVKPVLDDWRVTPNVWINISSKCHSNHDHQNNVSR